MAKELPQVLKGFRDYLPNQQMGRIQIIRKISETFEKFGFAPMDTPALESYDLFAGKIGEEEKLMYKFKDLGDREVALRYDLTVPLVRFLSENKNLPKPFKRYQIGNVWRADKPQKGRFREFMQCDIDIVGSSSALADAEIIAALTAAYNSLEIGTVMVKYNNRQLVDEALTKLSLDKKAIANFMRTLDKLDKIGEAKVIETLGEFGLDKNIFAQYAEIMDEISKKYVTETENLLSDLGVTEKKFDKFLMRGLDYYTGIVFEFVLTGQETFGSVGSGGRYDKLIGSITGTETPAVGGSLGLDRLFAALEDSNKTESAKTVEAIVFNLDENLTSEYLKIATDLRSAGISTEFYFETTKLDKQFKYAENKKIQVAVIYGSEEAKTKKINLKNLQTKDQVTVDRSELIRKIQSFK
jgi:histidyl-tRNA synthetase